jgi:deoxycytidylate deaminase/dephospho-CoA kinase
MGKKEAKQKEQQQKKLFAPDFSADTTIIGFTGSLGSGATFISERLEQQHKYKRYSLSERLKEIARERGIEPTVENLQNLGNTLRKDNGNDFLVISVLKKIKEDELKGYKGFMVDSIRNDGEVAALRQFPYFYLFSVHADKEKRQQRAVGSSKRFKKNQEFEAADDRDKEEEFAYGQQVNKCNYLADLIINNNEDYPKTSEIGINNFINGIYQKYILLLETKKEGRALYDRLPTVHETYMTMAYAESQRSSCLKRKVGCVIASISQHDVQDKAIKDTAHAISSGCNEVPVGTKPCVFSEFEKCYRDYLFELQADKIKHCPSCGLQITKPLATCRGCGTAINTYRKACPSCKKEIDIHYKCKCGSDIFKDYLTSGGKLLDMCKALHAEENALIYLTKRGILNSDELVLYTTTFPCNLCANKIVTAGIKKIVYADPYTMEEAKKTLTTGGVTMEKFEGIKSSAFFRLYK